MRCILVLNGHPHNDADHYVHALASAYVASARERHEVRRIDLAKLDFPVLRNPADWITGELPEGLKEAMDALIWADHVVILYPLWMGEMPALLKAMLEQLARPGVAIERLENGSYKKLLKGKTGRIIVTMGMPSRIYSVWFRAHSVKSLKRSILGFAGISPVKVSLVGNVEGSSAHRRKWLRKVEKLGWRGS